MMEMEAELIVGLALASVLLIIFAGLTREQSRNS